MTASGYRPVYFSFFMFDVNTRLFDPSARAIYLEHMKALADMGYDGFELHCLRSPEFDESFPTYADEVAGYAQLRSDVDDAGLGHIALATNVGSSPEQDVSSPEPSVREEGAEFIRSRIDITHALRGEIMMGPVVYPYGAWVTAEDGTGLWSDALQDELTARYETAAPVLDELGEYAATKNVKIAIEPITHWETPGPNTIAQTMRFLDMVKSTQVGVVIDSAHETLDGAGPEVFAGQVKALAEAGRLHYAQASPPDRGSLADSWIPWQTLFPPILANYDGPVAIEIFNALPAFAAGLRLSRRKYRIPGVDEPDEWPDAYQVAQASLERLRTEFAQIE